MPRPVVPILYAPRDSSRARSSCPCDGRIRVAFSATRRLPGVTLTPLVAIFSISLTSAHGSTTTPLPMIDSLPGRATPDGSRLKRYSTLPMTSVWPALCPPWKRTTTSARSLSQSTIFPLPSSPHWAPITATFAMKWSPAPSGQRDDLAVIEEMVAIQSFGLVARISHGGKARNSDPAIGAQPLGGGAGGIERQGEPVRHRRFRQRLQDRVGIEREAGGVFASAVAGAIATAAAEFATPRFGEDREADASVVFEAAVLDRIDGDDEAGISALHPRDHVAEARALCRRRLRQIECRQFRQRFLCCAAGFEELSERRGRRAGRLAQRGGILVVERAAHGIDLFGREL